MTVTDQSKRLKPPPSAQLFAALIGSAGQSGLVERLFEAAGDMILAIDRGGVIRLANPAAQDIAGFAPEELVGQSLQKIIPPGQRAAIVDLFKRYEQTTERHFVARGPTLIPILHRSGAIRQIEVVVEEITDMADIAFVAIARDATDRVGRHEQVETSERLLRALVEYGSDICTVVRADASIAFESPSLKKILGYERTKLVGMNALDFAHPDDQPRIVGALFDVLSVPDGRAEVEGRFQHKDGSWRILHLIGRNLLHVPAIDGVLINSRDVTDRVEIERQLRDRNQWLEQAQAIDDMGTWEIDIATRKTRWSAKFDEIVGFRTEDIDHEIDRFFAHVHPDDREGLSAALEKAISEKARSASYEYRFYRPDGALRYIRVYAGCILDEQGNIVTLSGVSQDVTDYRQALTELEIIRAQLEEAQRVARLGSWDLDIRSGCLGWSREVYNIFEIDPGSFTPSYEAFLEVIHPEDRTSVNAAYQESLKTKSPYRIEHRLLMPDGRIKWVEERCYTIYDDGGQAIKSFGTVQDVTENKEARLAVEAAREQADIANRAKSEFLANMSHELRTPLNAIIGFSELMDSEVFGPLGHEKYKTYISDIRKSGHHLLEVLSDVIDVSRVESGHIDLTLSTFSAGPLVEACRTMMEGRLAKKRQTLEIHIAGDAEQIYGDERLCKQMLLNLLSNASKFTDYGGQISVAVHRENPQAVAITVRDTGIGIKPEHIEKVLAPFGQVEGPLSRKNEGTGLGLTLTKSFAELHGGQLRLISDYGVGTEVTIFLPDGQSGTRFQSLSAD